MATTSDTTQHGDLTPSAKFVRFVLQERTELTQSQLTETTGLSERTVRSALSQLSDSGLVTEEVCLRDARKRVYSLAEN